MVKLAIPATLLAAAILTLAPANGAGRSIVGKKLPAVTLTDTEGRTISPSDYEGAVLVLFAGIPW